MRVEYPKPIHGAVVEIIQVRVPAEREEQALGGEVGAKIDFRPCHLPPAREHTNHHRMRQPLREHGELQALAGIPVQLQIAAVGGDQRPAAQHVITGDLHLQLPAQGASAIGHGDSQRRPMPGPEGVGEPHHCSDVHGVGGHRRQQRTLQREQQDDSGQALKPRPHAAYPLSLAAALPRDHVVVCNCAIVASKGHMGGRVRMVAIEYFYSAHAARAALVGGSSWNRAAAEFHHLRSH
jgi:hypothetical protein